jgi:glycogen operon protein
MILMGDEVRRTQAGNNNDYCHDNESNWLDWSLLKKHADVHRFVSVLAARRSLRTIEHEKQRLTLNQLIQQANKSWHGVKLNQPDWGDNSHSIAFTFEHRGEQMMVHLVLNAYHEPLDFELARDSKGIPIAWRRWIDTSLDSPNDITDLRDAPPIAGHTYHVESRTVAVLIADLAAR